MTLIVYKDTIKIISGFYIVTKVTHNRYVACFLLSSFIKFKMTLFPINNGTLKYYCYQL